MDILILNGPNLNLLGQREPNLYGTRSFEDYLEELRRQFPEDSLIYLQSNHEGDLIDAVQQYGFGRAAGIVLNAGGYTHTSISLRDAIAAVKTPVVEVHLTDITTREPFRKISYLTDVCASTVIGKGLDGYKEAIEFLKQ